VKVAFPVEKAALGLVRRNALRAGAVRLADRVIWEVLKRSDNPPGDEAGRVAHPAWDRVLFRSGTATGAGLRPGDMLRGDLRWGAVHV